MLDIGTPLYDMHCHLDFAGRDAAGALEADGVHALSTTVTPSGPEDHPLLSRSTNVRVATGLHPWWLADGRCGRKDVDTLVALVPRLAFVGEVGIDLARGRDAARAVQEEAFDRIMAACAQPLEGTQPVARRVVSVHAVRASGLVLDAIARNGTCESATVILHWFSGSADELRRAIEMGCLLSCGTRMLASSRGREYARQAPEERLLLETDLPSSPSPAFDPHDITHSLESAASSLAAIRGCDEAGLMDGLAERCGRILGM